MGYESRIYVVQKFNSCIEEGKRYALKLAMLDMGKCYQLSDTLRNMPETDCYIYADDGDTAILKDRYGKPLTETPLLEAVQIVKDVIANNPYEYFMYNVLLSTLQSFYDAVGSYEDFVVLHFGY